MTNLLNYYSLKIYSIVYNDNLITNLIEKANIIDRSIQLKENIYLNIFNFNDYYIYKIIDNDVWDYIEMDSDLREIIVLKLEEEILFEC
jgi:hypothetical protein